MPPGQLSRERFTEGVLDDEGRFYLTEPEPFSYRERADNVVYTVQRGDTLWTIAAKQFPSFMRPSGLWWVIAEFQPEPIFDPTVILVPGQQLILPSARTLLEECFSEVRRDEATA